MRYRGSPIVIRVIPPGHEDTMITVIISSSSSSISIISIIMTVFTEDLCTGVYSLGCLTAPTVLQRCTHSKQQSVSYSAGRCMTVDEFARSPPTHRHVAVPCLLPVYIYNYNYVYFCLFTSLSLAENSGRLI